MNRAKAGDPAQWRPVQFQGDSLRERDLLPEIFSFGKIIELVTKAHPRIFGVLFLFCLTILILPARALAWLNLTSLMETYRAPVSVVGLLTGLYLATYPLHALWKAGARFVQDTRAIRVRKNRLHHLTREEKKLFQSYVQRHTRTRRWNLGSGVVAGLVRDGILFRSSNEGSQVEGFAFNIYDWALEYLTAHQELIATPGDTTEPDAFP
jgi:hypothetical protein